MQLLLSDSHARVGRALNDGGGLTVIYYVQVALQQCGLTVSFVSHSLSNHKQFANSAPGCSKLHK